jgi:phosphoglycolate phosphatase
MFVDKLMSKSNSHITSEKSLSSIQLAIFDFDGTLFDTSDAIVCCLLESWSLKALPEISAEAILGCIKGGLSLTQTILKLLNLTEYLCVNEEIINEIIRDYRLIYQQKSSKLVKPFPGVEEFLRSLYSSGRIVSIVSHKGVSSILNTLSEHHLLHYFSAVAGDLGKNTVLKPNPAIFFEQILPQISCSKDVLSSTLVIGDTVADILFAQNLEAKSCWVSYGYGMESECRCLRPDIEVDSLEELRVLWGLFPNKNF